MDLFGNTSSTVVTKKIVRTQVEKVIKVKPVKVIKEKHVKEVKEVKVTKSYSEVYIEMLNSKMYLGSMYYLEVNKEDESFHFFKTHEADIDRLVEEFKSSGLQFIYKRFLPSYIVELRKQLEETKLMWTKHKTK